MYDAGHTLNDPHLHSAGNFVAMTNVALYLYSRS